MPASTATQFGKLLHLTHREQEIAALVAQGLTNREIAQRLGLSVFTVKSYVSNILRKLELKNRSQIALEEITQTFTQDTQALPTPRGEAAQEPSSESFTDADEYASMRVLDSKKGADSAPIWMKSEGDPSSQGEEGRQPSNLPEQSQQAPKKGDIYQRRTRYDDAYLQEYAEPLSQRFNAALRNPEDPLNHAAKQGLHVFAETMAQAEGTSLNEAAREHDLPLGSLHNWVRQRLVPTLYKDSHAVYIPKEAALKTAAVYRKAKEAGKQPARLLRAMFKK